MLFEWIIIGIIVIWLGIITVLFFKYYLQYQDLLKSSQGDSLAELLTTALKQEQNNKKVLEKLLERCDTLEKDGRLHIQKVGLVRFNPFKDTGGDQSFVLSLVDNENSGVIISSLHTRTGTRWYAKQVVKGKGLEYELSQEEEKALKI